MYVKKYNICRLLVSLHFKKLGLPNISLERKNLDISGNLLLKADRVSSQAIICLGKRDYEDLHCAPAGLTYVHWVSLLAETCDERR